MIDRSPNSCETSLTYGVSPQPAHAPENSNSGIMSCEFLIDPRLMLVRLPSGSDWKKSQLTFSRSRIAGCGAILIALRPTWRLSLTGQTSTHRVQPVQSSGETWRVYFMPGNSLKRALVDKKVSGACSRLAGS